MIGETLLRDSFVAMGTECAAAVTTRARDASDARRALTAARAEIASCELALSRFDSGSELARLNRHAGSWVRVDERLLQALLAALRLRLETSGRFDPTILPALVAAGYDRTFTALERRAARSSARWRAGAEVEVDLLAGRARVEAGAEVDLGGIGKGFSADRAVAAMRGAWPELAGALVDLGGDIAVWGATPDDGPWRLAIADPRLQATTLGTIALPEGAVATSGRDARRFGFDRELHHLIDPRTGAPAVGGPLAVTVVGRHGADVEAFATALAVSDLEEGHELLASRPSLSALVVPDNGEPVAIGPLPLLIEHRLTEVIA